MNSTSRSLLGNYFNYVVDSVGNLDFKFYFIQCASRQEEHILRISFVPPSFGNYHFNEIRYTHISHILFSSWPQINKQINMNQFRNWIFFIFCLSPKVDFNALYLSSRCNDWLKSNSDGLTSVILYVIICVCVHCCCSFLFA